MMTTSPVIEVMAEDKTEGEEVIHQGAKGSLSINPVNTILVRDLYVKYVAGLDILLSNVTTCLTTIIRTEIPVKPSLLCECPMKHARNDIQIPQLPLTSLRTSITCNLRLHTMVMILLWLEMEPTYRSLMLDPPLYLLLQVKFS